MAVVAKGACLFDALFEAAVKTSIKEDLPKDEQAYYVGILAEAKGVSTAECEREIKEEAAYGHFGV